MFVLWMWKNARRLSDGRSLWICVPMPYLCQPLLAADYTGMPSLRLVPSFPLCSLFLFLHLFPLLVLFDARLCLFAMALWCFPFRPAVISHRDVLAAIARVLHALIAPAATRLGVVLAMRHTHHGHNSSQHSPKLSNRHSSASQHTSPKPSLPIPPPPSQAQVSRLGANITAV